MPSGGLRYAATTGYYLTAFQAEIRLGTFHIFWIADDLPHVSDAPISPSGRESRASAGAVTIQ
jgi:hypothetical protein